MTLRIPVVDIAPFLYGDAASRLDVARAVNDACERTGFFIVTGHGVPRDLVQAASESARQFFDLDTQEKLATSAGDPAAARGYSALASENLAYTLGKRTPPDLKEAFSIGQVEVPGLPYYHGAAAGSSFAPNIWPRRPAGFEAAWRAYYQAMERLAADIMRIFALALGLPESWFEDKLDRHVSVMRALNYPAQESLPEPGQLRVGEHTDFGSLTILLQEDRPGGLQVLTRSGEWVDAVPVPDSFTINIGDLMQVWTNDRWLSNVHRVANPPLDCGPESHRQSIAFFQQPNYDALINCIDSCRDSSGASHYAPVTSGDHMHRKIARARTLAAPQPATP